MVWQGLGLKLWHVHDTCISIFEKLELFSKRSPSIWDHQVVFSNLSTLAGVFKKSVIGDKFHLCSVEEKPTCNHVNKAAFSNYPERCRGPSPIRNKVVLYSVHTCILKVCNESLPPLGLLKWLLDSWNFCSYYHIWLDTPSSSLHPSPLSHAVLRACTFFVT